MQYELYHHGILGMKWGIRRYQNKDGTLTAAGKKRYNNQLNDLKKLGSAHEKVDLMNRELRKVIDETPKGVTPLVPKGTKEDFAKAISDYKKELKRLTSKYGDRLMQYDRFMDDGRDYVVYALDDPKLNGVLEYFAFAKSKKDPAKLKIY